MIAIVPVVFAIVGLLMYLLCVNNAKAAEIGRIVFMAAFLVVMLTAASKQMRLF